MTDRAGWLSFPDAPRIVHPPPGPRSRELLADQARWETDAIGYPHYFPIAPRIGQGATIEDVDGNRFIDWVGGICVLNLGHRHPRIVAAVERQLEEIWHALELPTEARVRFLKELREVLPGKLRNHARVFFSVTGGDSVETAVSLADFATGRRGTVAFGGAYHGVHGGAVHLTSGRRYHTTSTFPAGSVVRVPYPDPYRPVLGADEGAAGTIAYLEHLVNDPHSGVDSISSVLVEPILGEGGYVVPPDDFLPSLREFCDRHGILLIADEVQTGLGRTGSMWAVEQAGVTPDILCIAKTIGGGLPLAVVAYRDDLVRELPRGFHLGTFRANPLALAAGAETLRILREGEIIDRTRHRGPQLLHRFRTMADRHPNIGDVRGRGFMIGVEFVHDRSHRNAWGDRAKAMRAALLARGVLMHTSGSWDQVLRFMSPLIIEDELLERGLAAFEDALESLESSPETPRTTGRVHHPVGPGAPHPVPEHAIPTPLVPPIPGRDLPADDAFGRVSGRRSSPR
ncbi:MAG TPA: aspartate aminotransferase family protein [Thermoplasmata archaeon]|nr:aspartate aminotransferase family protein [Thermoplasmata archaeon]